MIAALYTNPYFNQTFFEFFMEIAARFWAFLSGNLPLDSLASDEIQILVLSGVAASSALLGSFLILRKMAMLANALSHTILLGIVAAYILVSIIIRREEVLLDPFNTTSMLIASLIMGLATTFFTEFLNKTAGLQEDASIGIVFSSLFALGIILVTMLTRNSHIGTEAVMGNVDELQLEDCRLVLLTLLINSLTLFIFFKEFKITTFDQGLSRTLGICPTFYNYFLMTLVSATAISSFRAVGALMVLAFITGPAMTARLLSHNLKTMIFSAAGIGIFASFIGVALSRHFLTVYDIALSTGGIVVCVIGCVFFFALLFSYLKEKSFRKNFHPSLLANALKPASE